MNAEQQTILGGFAGNPGAGGSGDPSTGYLAPVAQVALGATDVYTYTFHLILGDLDTIRSYAYEHRPK